jgi:hypothetical protein
VIRLDEVISSSMKIGKGKYIHMVLLEADQLRLVTAEVDFQQNHLRMHEHEHVRAGKAHR